MIIFQKFTGRRLRGSAGVEYLEDGPCDAQAKQAGPDGRSAEEEESGKETCEAMFIFVETCYSEDKKCDRKDGAGGLS